MPGKGNPKTCFLILMFLFATVCPVTGKTIYVDADAAGANNGSSWADAYYYLQDALMFAVTGDEIRVAEGLYKPDDFVLSGRPNLGREETFNLINGVAVKGGYAGLGEPDPDARNVNLYETILSGDLNGDDVEVDDPCDLLDEPTRADNSYHVVTACNAEDTTVVDGFAITAGNADQPHPSAHAVGGGMHVDAGRPSVLNCTFFANSARSGGSVAGINHSKSTFTKCTFKHSFANDRGGGLAASFPTLVECAFAGNMAEYGGALRAFSGAISKCTFVGNSARAGGGAIQTEWLQVTGCTFSENTALHGGAIWFTDEDANTKIEQCIFEHNSATTFGGGADIYGNHTFEKCQFTGNLAGNGGAAALPDGARPIFTGCMFAENSAQEAGGALYSDRSNADFADCTIIGNSARRGGGMHNRASSPTLTNCTFSANWALSGAAISNEEHSDPILHYCNFTANAATGAGGAMHSEQDNSLIVLNNCLFAGNSATWGGALLNDDSHQALTRCTFVGNVTRYQYSATIDNDENQCTLTNCILWNNLGADGRVSEQVRAGSPDIFQVNYSCIQGWTSAMGGTGNTNADPCFAEPGYWDPNSTPGDANDDFWVEGDYHLKSQAGRFDPAGGTWIIDDVTSLCIDAGDPAAAIGAEPFGNGGIVNMGAYGGTSEASKSYFGKPPCETVVAGDINGDCTVDFKDFALMAAHWLEEH